MGTLDELPGETEHEEEARQSQQPQHKVEERARGRAEPASPAQSVAADGETAWTGPGEGDGSKREPEPKTTGVESGSKSSETAEPMLPLSGDASGSRTDGVGTEQQRTGEQEQASSSGPTSNDQPSMRPKKVKKTVWFILPDDEKDEDAGAGRRPSKSSIRAALRKANKDGPMAEIIDESKTTDADDDSSDEEDRRKRGARMIRFRDVATDFNIPDHAPDDGRDADDGRLSFKQADRPAEDLDSMNADHAPDDGRDADDGRLSFKQADRPAEDLDSMNGGDDDSQGGNSEIASVASSANSDANLVRRKLFSDAQRKFLKDVGKKLFRKEYLLMKAISRVPPKKREKLIISDVNNDYDVHGRRTVQDSDQSKGSDSEDDPWASSSEESVESNIDLKFGGAEMRAKMERIYKMEGDIQTAIDKKEKNVMDVVDSMTRAEIHEILQQISETIPLDMATAAKSKLTRGTKISQALSALYDVADEDSYLKTRRRRRVNENMSDISSLSSGSLREEDDSFVYEPPVSYETWRTTQMHKFDKDVLGLMKQREKNLKRAVKRFNDELLDRVIRKPDKENPGQITHEMLEQLVKTSDEIPDVMKQALVADKAASMHERKVVKSVVQPPWKPGGTAIQDKRGKPKSRVSGSSMTLEQQQAMCLEDERVDSAESNGAYSPFDDGRARSAAGDLETPGSQSRGRGYQPLQASRHPIRPASANPVLGGIRRGRPRFAGTRTESTAGVSAGVHAGAQAGAKTAALKSESGIEEGSNADEIEGNPIMQAAQLIEANRARVFQEEAEAVEAENARVRQERRERELRWERERRRRLRMHLKHKPGSACAMAIYCKPPRSHGARGESRGTAPSRPASRQVGRHRQSGGRDSWAGPTRTERAEPGHSPVQSMRPASVGGAPFQSVGRGRYAEEGTSSSFAIEDRTASSIGWSRPESRTAVLKANSLLARQGAPHTALIETRVEDASPMPMPSPDAHAPYEGRVDMDVSRHDLSGCESVQHQIEMEHACHQETGPSRGECERDAQGVREDQGDGGADEEAEPPGAAGGGGGGISAMLLAMPAAQSLPGGTKVMSTVGVDSIGMPGQQQWNTGHAAKRENLSRTDRLAWEPRSTPRMFERYHSPTAETGGICQGAGTYTAEHGVVREHSSTPGLMLRPPELRTLLSDAALHDPSPAPGVLQLALPRRIESSVLESRGIRSVQGRRPRGDRPTTGDGPRPQTGSASAHFEGPASCFPGAAKDSRVSTQEAFAEGGRDVAAPLSSRSEPGNHRPPTVPRPHRHSFAHRQRQRKPEPPHRAGSKRSVDTAEPASSKLSSPRSLAQKRTSKPTPRRVDEENTETGPAHAQFDWANSKVAKNLIAAKDKALRLATDAEALYSGAVKQEASYSVTCRRLLSFTQEMHAMLRCPKVEQTNFRANHTAPTRGSIAGLIKRVRRLHAAINALVQIFSTVTGKPIEQKSATRRGKTPLGSSNERGKTGQHQGTQLGNRGSTGYQHSMPVVSSSNSSIETSDGEVVGSQVVSLVELVPWVLEDFVYDGIRYYPPAAEKEEDTMAP